MTNQGSTFSMGYFSASIILHSLAVAGVFLMPHLDLLDEGSGHTIEFVAMDTPKGEQLETPVVAKKEVSTESPNVEKPVAKAPTKAAKVEKVEKPLPALKDLMVKSDTIPENLDSEISDEPVEEKIAQILPEKDELLPEPVLEAEEAPEDKFDEFLAEEADSVSEEAETATLAVVVPVETPSEVAEAKVEPPAPVETTAEEAPTPTDVVQTEELSADSTAVSEKAREDLKALAASEKPQINKATSPAGKNKNASQTKNSVTQTQSNKPYGRPSGKVRNYLDLTQVNGNRPPKYPTTARRSNQQGQVQLAYYVKSDGFISKMKMVRSSGYPLLDREAIRAVSKYRYKPGQEGWTVHPVNFQLHGPTKKMPSRLRTSSR